MGMGMNMGPRIGTPMDRSGLFAHVQSPLLMLLQSAASTTDYNTLGPCAVDCDVQSGMKQLEFFQGFNLCVIDDEKPMFLSEGVPMFRMLFGMKRAFHAIWSFDMEMNTPGDSIKEEVYEWCAEWNVDTYPVHNELLGVAWVAIPGFNFQQSATP